MHRREFLKKSAVTAAAIGFPTVIPSVVLGRNGTVAPSNRVGIGLIACGSRARYAENYRRYDKSEVVAVCDPRKDRRDAFSRNFGDCPAYNDFRDLLARADVDGVHIATADHWHVPIAMAAAKAGKDMYAEKPLGISIEQDLKAREIVDRYQRVFQYGAQQRSRSHVRLGIELVLNGHIGDVKQCYVWAPHGESGGSATPEMPVPAGFDYDMWLGPAPYAPFCEDRALGRGTRNGIFHIYDYAIGFIAGWGAHPMDMLQWYLDNAGMTEIPVTYEGTGVIPTTGLFNTVTNWDVDCTYANGLKMRFMDNQTADRKQPHPGVSGGHGTLFVGSEGWVRVSRGGWKVSSETLRRKATVGDKRLPISQHQVQNFVDCILSRDEPVDPLHSAVRSDVATHLSEISIRTGRTIRWDPEKEAILGDPEASTLTSRAMRSPWTL